MPKKVVFVTLGILALAMLYCGILLILKSQKKDFVNPLAGIKTGTNTEKYIENPLNGVRVLEAEKDKVLSRRPLVVMIGNNVDARPPSNVSMADMVYEVVAEGGITRFMTVFLQNEPEKVGPIRSIRAYFLYWVLELGDAMVMHDGFSSSPIREVSAVDLIDTLPVRSLFRGGYFYGWRDSSRLAPNNEYVSVPDARLKGDELGWNGAHAFDSWKFKEDEDKAYSIKPDATELNVVFWTPGDYDSSWLYDASKNVYLKSTGGVPHKDLETGVQLSAKNVIVQFAKETAVNDEKNHLLYDNIGSGKALIFLDGRIVEATWSKADARARTKFYDTGGGEIRFNRGVIWVCVVPDRNVDQVSYK